MTYNKLTMSYNDLKQANYDEFNSSVFKISSTLIISLYVFIYMVG